MLLAESCAIVLLQNVSESNVLQFSIMFIQNIALTKTHIGSPFEEMVK